MAINVFELAKYSELELKEVSFFLVLSYVKVSPSSTEYKITQGETVENITCSAVCWPICTFQWIGQNYEKDGAELIIENITISQSGRYQCQAKNRLRLGSSTFINIGVLCK